MTRKIHPRNKSKQTTRATLPVALTSFVGREREISYIRQLLPRTRLLTLSGAGGSGKTRLALQVAALLTEKEIFRDGVWWVSLAFLSNPDSVPQTVAGALGRREVPNESFTETLTTYLSAKQLLLVLDNCEHLVSACVALANELLTRCPYLKILTTSREAFGVGAEQIFQVPPLALPDSQQPLTLQTITESEAVRLFIERGQAINPEFSLTDTNAEAIVQVCRRLDGIPLAIELAATRLQILTVKQIASRLQDRFSLLTTGSRSALLRHQTLRATLDWSYDLLSAEEKILFRRLSIFAGGWTLEAAEAICGGEELGTHRILDLLGRLVDKSLVTMHELQGAARYQFLETIRVYALDKLEAFNETRSLHERHLDYCLNFVEKTFTGEVSWYYKERIIREGYGKELDNFRTALSWALDGAAVEKGAQLAGALLWFWNIATYQSEGNEWLSKALAFDNRISTRVRDSLLFAAIFMYRRQGKYKEAIAFGKESVALLRVLGDKARLANTLTALARAVCEQGDQARTIEITQESLQLFRELGMDAQVAVCDCILGRARIQQGDYEGSVPILEAGLALAKACQNDDAINESTGLLARVYRARGDFAQATILYNQSMTHTWQNGHAFGVAYGLEFYAILATMQNQSARAARLWGAAHFLREVSDLPLPAADRSSFVAHEENARRQLDEQSYARLFAEGAAMPVEKAVEYAMSAPIPRRMSGSDALPLSEEAAMRKFAALTAREYQIAMLISQGKSNREMAEQLVVSERTIEKHVGNLLAKLNLHSRTQVVAWVLEKRWLQSHV